MAQQQQQSYFLECPECHSRYFSEPLTVGGRNGELVRIHPICPECFEKCPAGHRFGYGYNCNTCGWPRRRFNLIRHAIDPDSTFGITTTGSQSYPTRTFGDTTQEATADEGGAASTNTLRACKFNNSRSLTTKKISIYFTNISSSYDCYTNAAVYTDSSGYPYSLNLYNTTRNLKEAGGWKDFTFYSTYMCLVAGTYWLTTNVYVTTATIGKHVYKTGTSNQTYRITGSYGGSSCTFPNQFPGSATGYAREMSIYCTGVEIKNYAKLYKANLPDNNADVTQFSFYSYTTGNARIGLYDDSGGLPNTLKWESNQFALTAAAWNNVNTSAGTPTSLTLPAGDYWFGWQVDTVDDAPGYTAGSSGDGNWKEMSMQNFPATWTGGTSSAEKWSEYATYTAPPPPTGQTMINAPVGL